MKRALRYFQTPIFVITILMMAVSGTIAADDLPDKLQSHVDESGRIRHHPNLRLLSDERGR